MAKAVPTFTFMLSICIPTYRYDVRALATELLRQATAVKGPVEILVYDDASPNDEDWGRSELRRLAGIRYVELKTNLGRAAIRNKMARDAQYDHLVMMDADGWPNPDFVSRYFEEVERKPQLPLIVTGGRTYAPTPPPDHRYHLHWWYGSQRESKTVARRKADGALGFQSNNFMVSKALLLRHPFPDNFEGYGHEDTVWGQQFVAEDVTICHYDNPVVHLGLEPNDVFLRKQEQAIFNLRLLKNESPHLRTRLIDLADKLPFLPAIARMAPERTLMDYLITRERPNLYALDLLKLRWWGKTE
ncbi:glycosyltransferase family 2 protein [Neolewinella aurantiaca]|uniref:Glycosyltransferase family 2 protein n=1 Tax=Neolewinella aurantiaca TaxID=2602767 RepID=A0A5C7FW39_9BACT|nr:glycosyltransferase family 2 protein [Neolewinella aurantiaca]TXF90875.1 glycosyltransferase family 2 protein [Neolewinella aurantiaca]